MTVQKIVKVKDYSNKPIQIENSKCIAIVRVENYNPEIVKNGLERIIKLLKPSFFDDDLTEKSILLKPNVFINITATIEDKIAAMLYYENEIRKFPHPRSAEALRSKAQSWGATIGVEYAEAFELIRSIR